MTDPYPKASDTSDRELVALFLEDASEVLHYEANTYYLDYERHAIDYLRAKYGEARSRGRILARMKKSEKWADKWLDARRDRGAYRTALLAANERRRRSRRLAHTYHAAMMAVGEERDTLRARLAEVEAEREEAKAKAWEHFLDRAKDAEARAEKAESRHLETVHHADELRKKNRELGARVRELEAEAHALPTKGEENE